MSSTAHSHDLYLDPSIRDWVLIPIMVVMVLIGVLRHYLTIIFTEKPKEDPEVIAKTQALSRSTMLRANASLLTPAAYQERKQYLIDAFSKLAAESKGATPNPLTDPKGMETMMEGMKKNMMNIIPQTLIMTAINYFFEGFVVIKIPFPLTPGFRAMLQRGIDAPDMDVTWVSSLSWYFLNFFGLRSLFTLILGEENVADASKDMAAMNPSMMMMGGTGAMDFGPAFKQECEALQLLIHKWGLVDIESKLLTKWRLEANGDATKRD